MEKIFFVLDMGLKIPDFNSIHFCKSSTLLGRIQSLPQADNAIQNFQHIRKYSCHFACNSAFISLVFCCDRFYYDSNFSNLSSDIMYNTSNSLNYLPLHLKNISRQSHIIMSFLSNNYSQCKLMPNINVFVIF